MYIWDLNTGLVWYLNDHKQTDYQLVCYSNGDLNTGQFVQYFNAWQVIVPGI